MLRKEDMKPRTELLAFASMAFLVGCSKGQPPYQSATSMSEVNRQFSEKQIVPICICDYIFYQYENYDVIVERSNDDKTVLKSASYPTSEVTEAEFALIQSSMSPFVVVSIVGTPSII